MLAPILSLRKFTDVISKVFCDLYMLMYSACSKLRVVGMGLPSRQSQTRLCSALPTVMFLEE